MIVTSQDLEAIRKKHKDKKIVVSGGTFDLLHANHVAYIRRSQSYGDIHLVFLNADKRVRRSKGAQRPIISETDRALLLDAIKGVDYVYIVKESVHPDSEHDEVYVDLFARLAPDVFVSTNEAWAAFQDIMGDTQFILLPRIAEAEHTSTSAIIGHIVETHKAP